MFQFRIKPFPNLQGRIEEKKRFNRGKGFIMLQSLYHDGTPLDDFNKRQV